MTDPDDLLLGAHLNLRKVRYVTCVLGEPIPTDALIRYTREAAALAAIRPAGGSEAASGLMARSGRRPPVRPRGS